MRRWLANTNRHFYIALGYKWRGLCICFHPYSAYTLRMGNWCFRCDGHCNSLLDNVMFLFFHKKLLLISACVSYFVLCSSYLVPRLYSFNPYIGQVAVTLGYFFGTYRLLLLENSTKGRSKLTINIIGVPTCNMQI